MSAPSTEPRSRWRTVGIVGAACVACCAGPLLAAVGGIGILGSLAAFVLWPAAGVAVAAMTVCVVVYLRRRRPDPEGPEPVHERSIAHGRRARNA